MLRLTSVFPFLSIRKIGEYRENTVQRFANIWASLDNRRRAMLIFASAVVVLTVIAMTRLATTPSMSLLYAGLEQGVAGEVVSALEQRGAAFEVRGGSIFVEASQRDQLRMTLAGDGLPANGSQGYELLDSLNGFGTTSQMFDAAYWRAKEGELARTIVTNPSISHARVHIANTGLNPFSRTAKATASVSITSTGGVINAAKAQALQHLVASAVSGLAVEDVTVIDSSGTLLGNGDPASQSSTNDHRTTDLRERVLRLVEARVGRGNAVVEVSVETVTETEAIRERVFDPSSRVAISTDTEERSNTASEQADGVTVASNLPDGDAAEGETARAETSETRERVNYEVSETEREIVRAAGAIRRVTVAVLVNGINAVNDDGTAVFEARSQEELNMLRELIASAVGYDDTRGDVISIHSMELPTTSPEGTEASTPFLNNLALDVMSLIQMAILAIVALVIALFVVRPLLSRSLDAPGGTLAIASEMQGLDELPAALTGEVADTASDNTFAALPEADWQQSASISGDPVDRLRNMISERREETVEILKNWLEDKEDVR